MRQVDGQAAAVIATYLDLADQHADGLIEALYLEGSLALGDFQAGTSDIDFIAVTTDQPDSAALDALHHVHEELATRHHRPFFDGIYLTWPQVAAGPTSVHNPPASHEGRFISTSSPEKANPVTWHTLAQHAITCRGPSPSQLDIWTDSTELAAWQNTNLDEYWLRNLTRARRLLNPSSLALLTDYGTVWTVTGIARLHYTIATEKIASKTQAAQYALNTFPQQWHPVIREALRVRTREHSKPLYTNRLRRRRDILSFGHMAITDAHRIYTEHQP
ncbi:hypothetical protein A5779_17080 [Mycolicibacterium peregrinum]|uniref:Adenylyltransferase AadA C-terminal domain-containing protein n=1 Tax=Mycolicibacterium peregrinum TaxID=43304 RepID=A0A1A0WEG9_MYCPR|nr:hypothetical protein A5779_17080 [Mycolicibacterium peregrinum]